MENYFLMRYSPSGSHFTRVASRPISKERSPFQKRLAHKLFQKKFDQKPLVTAWSTGATVAVQRLRPNGCGPTVAVQRLWVNAWRNWGLY